MFGIDDAIIGSVGGALMSGLLNNSAASARQDTAQEFSAEQYATRYQTSVKDMQAAGLNPMLAYGGLSGSSPTSSAASSAGTPDLGAAYLQSKMNNAQVANIQADTENKKAQAAQIEADTNLKTASAGQASANIQLVNANVDKVREEIKNIPTEGKRLYEATKMLYEQSNLLAAQGKSEQFRQSVLRATASKLVNETKLLDFDISAISKFDNFGKEYQQYKPIIDLLKSIFQPRGGGITINK